MSDENLLQVRDLEVHFKLPKKGLFGDAKVVHAVDGVSFDVKKGQTFGLVGESGSGKTTTALAVMRLVQATDGAIALGGDDVLDSQGDELRKLRRKMQIIFQDLIRPSTRVSVQARSCANRWNC